MQRQRIEYRSPLDALIAITKRLSIYENHQKMTSDEFFDRYNRGELSDDLEMVEWAADYRQFLGLRQDVEQRLQNAAQTFIEALQIFPNLKIWKGETLESETAHGAADYLITENFDYAEAPMLCVAEAKKDDFEQGLAQCLVEMQACQWTNQKVGKTIDIFGIVTNGEGWKFYKLTPDNQVYGTLLYTFLDLSEIFGVLNTIFQSCQQNL